MATSTGKGGELEDQFVDASEGGVLHDPVVVDEVGQDLSKLKDQFVVEVCSYCYNKVIVLTPPNCNKDAYANKLALFPHH